MKTEIIVVLIASIASFIVGFINIIFNARISAKQNAIELKKTRIELLDSRIQKIEGVKSVISERVIDVSNIKQLNFDIHFPRFIDFFQKNSSNVFSIGHLLDPEFINKLKTANKKINEYISTAKQGIQINDEQAKKDIDEMRQLSDRIINELDKKLLESEIQINQLLKK